MTYATLTRSRVFRTLFLAVMFGLAGYLLWWVAYNLAWRAPMDWYIRARISGSVKSQFQSRLYARTRYESKRACESAIAALPRHAVPYRGVFCERERVYDAQQEALWR